MRCNDGRGARPGEAHHKAKLTDGLVREIRRQYDNGRLLREIDDWLYSQGVDIKSCYGTLYPIVKRRAWKHVE
jgi:hypothetical protein